MRVGDLEVSQDLEFERREGRVQTVAWTIAAAILIAALAGLLGPGPLSSTSVSDPGGRLTVDYERVVRREARTVLRIRLAERAVPGGAIALWLGRDLIDGAEIQHMEPRPSSSTVRPDRVVYRVGLDASGPAEIIVHLEPQGYGPVRVTLGVEGGPSVGFRQLVLP